jgi:hypothetical protein
MNAWISITSTYTDESGALVALGAAKLADISGCAPGIREPLMQMANSEFAGEVSIELVGGTTLLRAQVSDPVAAAKVRVMVSAVCSSILTMANPVEPWTKPTAEEIANQEASAAAAAGVDARAAIRRAQVELENLKSSGLWQPIPLPGEFEPSPSAARAAAALRRRGMIDATEWQQTQPPNISIEIFDSPRSEGGGMTNDELDNRVAR